MTRYALGCVHGSISETSERAEAISGGDTNEIEAGHGALEIPIEHGRVFGGSNLFAQAVVEEAEPLESDAITSTTDNVIGLEFGRSVVPREREVDLVALDLCMPQPDSKMRGNVSIHLVADKPAGRGAQMTARHLEAKLLRHDVKQQRDIRAKTRAPSKPKPGARLDDSLDERTRFLRWVVKCDCTSAGDDLRISSNFAKDYGDIDC